MPRQHSPRTSRSRKPLAAAHTSSTPSVSISSQDTAATWTKASELAWAVPQVIAIRSARMLSAGAQPSARDQEEFARMGAEKVDAWMESCSGVAAQVLAEHQNWTHLLWGQWVNMCSTPWPQLALIPAHAPTQVWDSLVAQTQRSVNNLAHSTLEPMHKRATANARRLLEESDC